MMNASDEPASSGPLRRLERRVRLLTALVAVLLASVLGVGYFSLRAPLGLTVTAREYLLVDPDGGVRGRFGPSHVKYATANDREVSASTTCLVLYGRDSFAHLQACSAWDAPPWTSLLMTDSEGQKLLLSADDEGATVAVGRRREMGKGEDNAKVTIAVGDSAAEVQLRGRRQRGTLLSLDGIRVYSEDRRTLAQLPVQGNAP